MEDVLVLYAEPYDPPPAGGVLRRDLHPAAGRGREPLPPQPGRPRRQDYEYRRGGTRNLFLACEPLAGWRHVAITERRTMQDFAQQMRWLVDVAYPDAPVVRVVLDNLNTHRMASLYETQRNAAGITIDWRFSTHDARAKLHRFYPCLSNVD